MHPVSYGKNLLVLKKDLKTNPETKGKNKMIDRSYLNRPAKAYNFDLLITLARVLLLIFIFSGIFIARATLSRPDGGIPLEEDAHGQLDTEACIELSKTAGWRVC